MDDESGESMEAMEEVPLMRLGVSQNWRDWCVVDGEKPGVDKARAVWCAALSESLFARAKCGLLLQSDWRGRTLCPCICVSVANVSPATMRMNRSKS